MFRSLPVSVALLMHSIVLAYVPVFAVTRWSGLTFRGITVLLIAFSLHAAGIFGIVKRLKWGYSFSKKVFGFYMVTSGLGLLSLGTRHAEAVTLIRAAIFFLVFAWLFTRFRSDPTVRTHFDS